MLSSSSSRLSLALTRPLYFATRRAAVPLLTHGYPRSIRSVHLTFTRCHQANAPQKEAVDAAAKALDLQADSGIGSSPITDKPPPVPGTLDVTIGGERGPKLLTVEEHEMHADPSIKRHDKDWTLSHPLWKDTYVGQVAYTHLPPQNFIDKLALATIKTIRFNFDWMSGYSFGKLTIKKALTRVVFLETVAGVPGSVAGTIRHLASLRRMKRDGGWISSLLAEAENERMHLLTFLQIRKPGPVIRSLVFLSQGVFFNFFFLAYLVSPTFCHRLVGYLEEEAVVTYTKMLQDIDAGGELKEWQTTPAPDIAIKYWSLKPNATMRDVISHIRADEAHHRDVNHALGSIDQDALNPFRGRA